MQYELYPENTEQALRQIFIVNEVEVRDRLALSRINKFLYQYTSESLPRQTHANMVSLYMGISPETYATGLTSQNVKENKMAGALSSL